MKKAYKKIPKEDLDRTMACLVHRMPEQLYELVSRELHAVASISWVPKEIVAEYLKDCCAAFAERKTLETAWRDRKPLKKRMKVLTNHDGPFKSKTIYGYRFGPYKQEVWTWQEMLYKMTAIIAKENPYDFEECAILIKGSRRCYFSKDKTELEKPYLVPSTDLYVELNLSANNIKALCDALVRQFDYGQEVEVW